MKVVITVLIIAILASSGFSAESQLKTYAGKFDNKKILIVDNDTSPIIVTYGTFKSPYKISKISPIIKQSKIFHDDNECYSIEQSNCALYNFHKIEALDIEQFHEIVNVFYGGAARWCMKEFREKAFLENHREVGKAIFILDYYLMAHKPKNVESKLYSSRINSFISDSLELSFDDVSHLNGCIDSTGIRRVIK